jgi:hypothetical protein
VIKRWLATILAALLGCTIQRTLSPTDTLAMRVDRFAADAAELRKMVAGGEID